MLGLTRLDLSVFDIRWATGLFKFDKLYFTWAVSYFWGPGTSLFLMNLSLRVEARYKPSFLVYDNIHLVKKLWDIVNLVLELLLEVWLYAI
jgi:hypothetical protein